MGFFRFRRSVKIAPGVRLNFSKSGVSTSVGTRGARVTFGHGKVRQTVGIPGTGLGYTETTRTRAGGNAEGGSLLVLAGLIALAIFFMVPPGYGLAVFLVAAVAIGLLYPFISSLMSAARSDVQASAQSPPASANAIGETVKALEGNMPWLRERWQLADQLHAKGELGLLPKWYFDPPTEPQLNRVKRIGLTITADALTKGAASDIIGLFEPPADHDAEVLRFFKVQLPPAQRNETRAGAEVIRLFEDPARVVAWQARPADAMAREFLRHFGVTVPRGLTVHQAETMRREIEAKRTDAELDAWRDFADTFEALNDPGTREDAGIKRVSLSIYREVVDAMKASGQPVDLRDELAIAEKVLELHPELARAEK